MMKRVLLLAAIFTLAGSNSSLSAQAAPPTGAPGAAPGAAAAPALPVPAVGPPIARIESASYVSKEAFRAINSVRELPDGNLLVNDGTGRRLILLDSTLTVLQVVMDSISEGGDFYGTRAAGMIPYRADSTLFLDGASYSMLTLDPHGRAGYVGAVWSTTDVSYASSTSPTLYGIPGSDPLGRVIYRKPAIAARPAVIPTTPGIPYLPPPADSAFIVRADLDTRRLDTLGVIRLPKTEQTITPTSPGATSFTILSTINPAPTQDDWAVLSDGTVAFVRGQDYRIEYLSPDGRMTSSEKLPYEWQRLLDEDKVRLVDSTRTAQTRSLATSWVYAVIRWVNQYGQLYPKDFTVPEGFTLPIGMGRGWLLPPGVSYPENYVYACGPGETPVVPPAPATPPTPGAPVIPATPSCLEGAATLATGGIVPPLPVMRQAKVFPASTLPDYRPAFGAGAVRADMDGNLWIRTNQPRPIPGGLVYDVVNREGVLTTRIQVPTGYTLVGFGKNKGVYLSVRDATGLHLARVRLR